MLVIFVFLTEQTALANNNSIILGDAGTEEYLPMLTEKRVAIF